MPAPSPAASLSIRPRRSRRLLTWILVPHLLAASLAPALGRWGWGLAVLILVAALVAVLDRVHARLPWSIVVARWDADGGWRLWLRDGRELHARLSAASFVAPGLVVLHWRIGWLRRRALVLFADALDADTLRRLRVRLRQQGRAERGGGVR
ncbi:protein YgfX [Marichromatium bheemlicum]|uniref:Toxin CptA n=1 Tax=Marichromatium bheemlicum TaxID=365339 RepID=A0ABX1I906_9GAMM|nr:protein YgfX [Marichromatium bheemlicum]NKN33713.1 hypothetical protein [Marichromatium bheemlicum]